MISLFYPSTSANKNKYTDAFVPIGYWSNSQNNLDCLVIRHFSIYVITNLNSSYKRLIKYIGL